MQCLRPRLYICVSVEGVSDDKRYSTSAQTEGNSCPKRRLCPCIHVSLTWSKHHTTCSLIYICASWLTHLRYCQAYAPMLQQHTCTDQRQQLAQKRQANESKSHGTASLHHLLRFYVTIIQSPITAGQLSPLGDEQHAGRRLKLQNKASSEKKRLCCQVS